jgi:transcriptional regulator with XRE-family HTH domain
MERMRELREAKGLSQAQAAVAAGMNPATWNRLEQGKGNPNLRTLERVADSLGVQVVDLLGKASAPPAPQLSFNDVGEEERRDPTPAERHAVEALTAFCGQLEDFVGYFLGQIANEAPGVRLDAIELQLHMTRTVAALTLPLLERPTVRPLARPAAIRLVELWETLKTRALEVGAEPDEETYNVIDAVERFSRRAG